MRAYLDLLNRVLTEGDVREDRTGVGTRSILVPRCGLICERAFQLSRPRNFSGRAWFMSFYGFFAEKPISAG